MMLIQLCYSMLLVLEWMNLDECNCAGVCVCVCVRAANITITQHQPDLFAQT